MSSASTPLTEASDSDVDVDADEHDSGPPDQASPAPTQSSALGAGPAEAQQKNKVPHAAEDGCGARVSCNDVEVGSVVYMRIKEQVLFEQVLEILEQGPKKELVSHEPPCRPLGGSVFVFPSNITKQVRRCDQYLWCNDGVRKMPKTCPILRKYYFYLKKTDGSKTAEFRKCEYELLSSEQAGNSEDDSYVLVEYIGDHTIAETNAPHGNSVKSRLPFYRSSMTVKTSINAQGTDTRPAKVYRNLVASNTTAAAEAVSKPRNVEQVRNFQKAARRRFRIGHDGLYNCVELATQFPAYVRYIQVCPDLVIHLVNGNLLKELCTAIDVTKTFSLEAMELQYDTTFKLGDFYVSVLSFRHSVFRGRPIIPVAFMIHKRKFKKDHQRFMEFLKEICPTLEKNKCCLVTDSEFDFSSTFPTFVHAHCWNHIKNDVRMWLRKNLASADDIRVYSDHLQEFLMAESQEAFSKLEEEYSPMWSSLFVEYFKSSLKSRIENHSGRLLIEPTGLFAPYSGFTTNPSESMNRVLHDLAEWKEKPVDGMLISLKYLQEFYIKEITRGLHGLGNYVIRMDLSAIRQPAELMPPGDKIMSPTDIVNCVRNGVDAQCEGEIRGKRDKTEDVPQRVGQEALAAECVQNGNVTFVADAKAFMVGGSGNNKYAITLFPKESCQCASRGNCYHIMAAKIHIGMATSAPPKQQNLSLLRRKRLGRSEKKSGRKKPRLNDYEVQPAPDSANTQASASGSSA